MVFVHMESKWDQAERDFSVPKEMHCIEQRLSPCRSLPFLGGRAGKSTLRGGNCFVTPLFKFRLRFVGVVQTWSHEPLTQPLSLLITSSDSSYYF